MCLRVYPCVYLHGVDTLAGNMVADDNGGFWIGDRYCGLFRIGSGGMGEVWAGKAVGDRGFERPVAIKRILFRRRRKESHHRAIIDEAAVLQHLSASPNIVNIIDLREEDGQPYLIMEYIDGAELKDVIEHLQGRGERLPLPLAFYIANEISKGLSSAHACKHPQTGEPLNIVHRDVSPSNVMLSSQGLVKLTDFGIAKHELQTAETQIGEIKGKFRYMAPEQARGEAIDRRADYFALGLTFYECLFGKPAYDADSDASMIDLARSGRIPYDDEMGRDILDVLKRLLAVDPAERYLDLERFRNELGMVALQRGGIATAEELSKFLAGLDIPEHRAAIRRRKKIEESRLLPAKRAKSVSVATGTTRPSLLGWIRSRPAMVASAAIIVISVISAGTWMFLHPTAKDSETAPVAAQAGPGSVDRSGVESDAAPAGVIDIKTVPAGASILIRHSNRRIEAPSPALLTDIPLDTPIQIEIAKAGYENVSKKITLLKENPRFEETFSLSRGAPASVRFSATPPSQVTVPGQFDNLDAPSPLKRIPPGTYRVIFSNPLAGSKAVTTLVAAGSGSYVCSANMQIDPTSGQPTEKAPTASCTK